MNQAGHTEAALPINLTQTIEEAGARMIIVSDAWETAYPGAVVGIMVMRNVSNPPHHLGLDRRKQELERELRARFAHCDRSDLKAVEPIKAYDGYFRRFKKTYPVQLQLESVVFKGQSIPRVAALIEAMFMAELKNLLLTAGHDLETLQMPIRLDVSKGGERYTRLNGQEQVLKSGDMMMADTQGIISSVLYGPDHRTRITAITRHVFFAVYAPPGIGKEPVYRHLQDIQENVLVVAPNAQVELMRLFCSGSVG